MLFFFFCLFFLLFPYGTTKAYIRNLYTLKLASSPSSPGLCSVIYLHVRKRKRWYHNIVHSDVILIKLVRGNLWVSKMLSSRKVWDLLSTTEHCRLLKNPVSRVRPRYFMLPMEGGFPEIQVLWRTAVKCYIVLSLSEVLTKGSQKLAETKATACSAAEISR